MIRIRATPVLPALAAALLAAPAPTQEATPQPVPRELAEALAGATGASELVVGRLPAGFPEITPADGRVLGGVERPSGRNVAVLASARPCDQAAAELRARLLREGWSEAPAQPLVQRGFVQSGVTGPSGVFCRGSGTVLRVSAVPRRGGGSYLSVHHSGHAGEMYDACDPRQRGMPPHGTVDAPLPPLHAPAGAEQHTFGMMMMTSENQYTGNATVLTEADAGALVGHYAVQLRQAGWNAAQPVAVSGMAAQTFRFRDGGGRDWHAVLFVTEIPDTNRRAAELRLSELKRRTD